MLTPQELMGKYVAALNERRWYDVIEHTTEIIKKNDTIAHVWANRAAALGQLGQNVDAILSVDRAIALEASAKHFANKGCFYWNIGNAKKALAYLHESVAIEPLAQAKLTMGNIYKYEGKLNKALHCYRESVAIDPEYADGHLVLAMTLLKMGQLQEGWKEYEWRWKTDQLPPRKLPCPRWAGEDLTNKTILVYGEQGLGDMLQFARYTATLAQQFPRAKIILEGKPHVRRLFETLPDVYAVINAGDKLPHLDYAIPLMSLAGALTPNISAIVNHEIEYFLNPVDVENWGERFNQLPEGFRVGVCWSGMARTENPHADAVDKLRSTTLSEFAPLAKIPGITWISLQKGPAAEQIKAPPSGMTIVDMTDEMLDFYDTCCAIHNCDLVISVDTAVLHAAASIGVPTWLLSRWDGCWRWFGDRADSPWYPSLRQFVQPAPHNWPGLMNDVKGKLADLVKNKDTLEFDLTLAK